MNVWYCDAHAEQGRSATAERNRRYDQQQRDPEAKAFYNSAAWLNVRRDVLADEPVCRRCNREWAAHVHHIRPLKECTPAERLDRDNLEPLCQPCHNEAEREAVNE
jgi:5-methylcytosine-specific restriction enzyme A